jgi:hypothetical protein
MRLSIGGVCLNLGNGALDRRADLKDWPCGLKSLCSSLLFLSASSILFT